MQVAILKHACMHIYHIMTSTRPQLKALPLSSPCPHRTRCASTRTPASLAFAKYLHACMCI